MTENDRSGSGSIPDARYNDLVFRVEELEAGGGGGGDVPFVGVDPPDSPTDGMLWWDPDDDTPSDDSPGAITVVGPYHVDFTDIVNLNDSVELFTPSAGQIVVACWPNPRTMTQFSDGIDNSPVIVVGQETEIGSDPGAAIVWAVADSDLVYDQTAIGAGNQGPGGSLLYPVFGSYSPDKLAVTVMHPLDEPVICKYLGFTDEPDLEAGAVDWYFAISTPVVPS